jgi:hypothetical protein
MFRHMPLMGAVTRARSQDVARPHAYALARISITIAVIVNAALPFMPGRS